MTWCQECYSQKQYCESCSKINSQKLVRPEKLIKIPDPDSFIAIECSKEDLESIEKYTSLTKEQKNDIYEIAQDKLSEMIMPDYWDSLEIIVENYLN